MSCLQVASSADKSTGNYSPVFSRNEKTVVHVKEIKKGNEESFASYVQRRQISDSIHIFNLVWHIAKQCKLAM